MRALVVILCLALGACGSTATGFDGPAEHLMKPPHAFPRLKPGDDMAQALSEAAAAHNHNARKIRGLQKYIRKVRQS